MNRRAAPVGERVRDLLNRAGEALNAQRLDEARRLCVQALELEPRHAAGRGLAGVVEHARGDFQAAHEHLREAVSLAPEDAGHHQNLALVWMSRGDFREALAELSRVLELEPDNVPAAELRAEALTSLGEFEHALALYQELIGNNPQDSALQGRLVNLLAQMPMRGRNPAVDQAVARLLESPNVEPTLLAVPIARLVMARHGMNRNVTLPPIDGMADDELLISALRTLYFTEPGIERTLTGLRRRMFTECVELGRIPREWRDLAGAMAVHNLRNESAYAIGSEEAEAVDRLAEKLAARLAAGGERASPEALAAMVTLIGLYRSPAALDCAEPLSELAGGEWPEPASELVRLAFDEPRREREAAASVPALAEIQGETSAAVRAMYEDNPYPRWDRLGPVVPGTVAERLARQLPSYRPTATCRDGALNVLIAGCGTGRHALRAAAEYTNAHVTAIDISLRSLGYAARRAQELELDNVEFLQADLFDLPGMERRFAVVESIGTLETLDDPEAGWRVLAEMTDPGGVLYIGSYSEVARRSVIAARKRIRELGLGGTPDDMREFRRRVLDGELGADGRMLLRCGDFYSLSGCRDLLFHVSEKRFRIRELAAIWERLGLRFLGFHPVRPELREAFQRRYPEDPYGRKLANWMDFEENDPDSFCRLMNLSMLYYWLEKGEAAGT